MIKKQLTITSIAILVAAISVATTMTMVQADIDGDDVDITIPAADTTFFGQVEVDVGVEATTFITDAGHPITVDIHDTDEEVWVEMTSGATTTDPIMITIDDIQWVGMTGAIGSFECNENNDASSMAFFTNDHHYSRCS